MMRRVIDINDDWFFTKEKYGDFPHGIGEGGEKISLPHTWNGLDGQDGGADYYKGECYYLKSLYIPYICENRKYYLEFDAVASECTVFCNGEKIAEHAGGYSRFRVDIGGKLRCGKNVIAIIVNNAIKNSIYPQMADFTFYGGVYRGVKLIEVGKTHFELGYYGSDGVTAKSEILEDGGAVLSLESYTVGAECADTVRYTVCDREGETVAEVYASAEAPSVNIKLSEARLWRGVKDPYLYTVTAQIIRGNEVLDQVTVRHGIRSFYVDPQKGFYLNGELTPLRGVSRHQDRLGKGNALSLQDHREDAALIAELGANTVRLAHYQHAQEFYDLCDEYGFVVWAEIPFISRMSPEPEAHGNCISQLTELIIQCYNHPSVCFWGIANEITIGGASEQLENNLRELDALVKKLDPHRISTIAQVSMLPQESSLNGITDVVAYNHYFGWYGGALEDNERWFDGFHEKYPDRAIGISEYGCEGIIAYHGDEPKMGDYSEEYQALYHEHMLKLLERRPWIWGSYVWNAFDFGCDARDEGGVKGRNNKGLITFDRKIKKDAFYLYKAYWGSEPVLHVCGKRYYARTGEACIKVYTNLPAVRLLIDGRVVGEKGGDRVLVFDNIPLHGGVNCITAVGDGVEDSAWVTRVDTLPECFTLKADGEGKGVTNWFDGREMASAEEMTFRDSYFSVRDTVREVLENEVAARILTDVLSSVSGMALKSSMLMMMADQTVEGLLSGDLAAAKLGEDVGAVLATVNAELQRIPKE